ncbi:unnamed protein product [Cylicocyclus nassatus]|uniref:Tyrosine-protein kinase n=1 Tax=Cylicocyclus nassatus TaxID=53992 RepID=A0AA36GNM6_CYLNA|nr:unnamed protein product [Cylicocyclus nassatus]
MSSASRSLTANNPVCENFDVDLMRQPYYHGLLLRDDVPYLLHHHGEFLVRVAQADKNVTKLELVLSVFHDPEHRYDRVKVQSYKDSSVIHLVIQSTSKKKYYIDQGKVFNTVHNLIQYFLENTVVVRGKKVQLKKGITLARWEFGSKSVKIGERIGGTGYEKVCKCNIKVKENEIEAVAITIAGLSPNSLEILKRRARQCRLLRDLRHPCIVQYYGMSMMAPPCRFLCEYVQGEKLNLYLTKQRGKLKRDEMLRMTISAAWGLDYLHSKGILHLDVAAKNCFYNQRVVKIYGFDLAQKALVYTIKSLKKLPVRWMAPESVEMFRFSQKSDIYSYGVLVYEIFAQREPYEGKVKQEAEAEIRKGNLNIFPNQTPKKLAIYVKDKIWNLNPSHRPTMQAVVKFLSEYTGMELEIKESGESKIHQSATAAYVTDVDYIVSKSEHEGDVFEAVMIGGGKRKAEAEKPKKAPKSPKEPAKPKELPKPIEEPLPASAEKVVPPSAEKMEETEKVRGIPTPEEVFAGKLDNTQPEEEEAQGAFAFLCNRTGDLLYDIGAALVRAIKEEAIGLPSDEKSKAAGEASSSGVSSHQKPGVLQKAERIRQTTPSMAGSIKSKQKKPDGV